MLEFAIYRGYTGCTSQHLQLEVASEAHTTPCSCSLVLASDYRRVSAWAHNPGRLVYCNIRDDRHEVHTAGKILPRRLASHT